MGFLWNLLLFQVFNWHEIGLILKIELQLIVKIKLLKIATIYQNHVLITHAKF